MNKQSKKFFSSLPLHDLLGDDNECEIMWYGTIKIKDTEKQINVSGFIKTVAI